MTATRIPLLVPDMPGRADLSPYLAMIDEARWYTNFGPLLKRFEQDLLNQFAGDSDPCAPALTTVANGTLALELALAAMSLPKNATVLIPAFTFVATASAVVRAGFRPVIADIDGLTWLLTPAIARAAMDQCHIDCVLPVAALGCPVPTDEWDDFSLQTGVPVLVDAAGAFGNQKIGKQMVVAFSLHATKALGVGEGGMVVSHNHTVIDRVRRLANFGIDVTTGLAPDVGSNAKLSEFHAAVGLASIARWPERRELRRQLHERYCRELMLRCPGVKLQKRPLNGIYTILQLLLPEGTNRFEVAGALAKGDIETRAWYLPLLPEHPAYAGMAVGDLRVALKLGPRMLGLPFHLHLSEGDISRIYSSLAEVLEKN